MKVMTQLSVFLANRPGVLGDVASALASQKVNILAISISDTVDHAVVRLIVDQPARATEIFEDRGSLVVETKVLGVSLSNEPGVLARYAKRLSRAKVNIEYVYGSTQPGGHEALVVFRVDDAKKALKALK